MRFMCKVMYNCNQLNHLKKAMNTLPSTLRIDLEIDDMDVISMICAQGSQREQNDIIRRALRIGTMAMNNAQARVDTQAIKNEGDRLLQSLQDKLGEHQKVSDLTLTSTLKEYFDPKDGRFNARVEGLITQDGEIERLITSQLQHAQAAIGSVLAEHLGSNSPIIKALEPGQSNQLLGAISQSVEQTTQKSALAIASEFSLDNPSGALSRLIKELSINQQGLSDGIQKHVQNMVSEFSLDNENSALSRLVKRVETAQQQITSEFSLDEKGSALARIKSEIEQLIAQQTQSNNDFQARILAEFEAMKAKKKAQDASTTHGHEFESAALEVFSSHCNAANDILEETGSTTGFISRSKIGDGVITLGPDNAAAGARIVLEMKEDASYTLKSTLEEIEVARKNRQASVGVFVHSKKTAPVGLAPMTRYGHDILVLWDKDDESTDVWLHAAFMSAKALAWRLSTSSQEKEVDATAMEKSIQEIERQAEYLEEIRTWSNTISSNTAKIIDRSERMKKALKSSIEVLSNQLEIIKA